MRTFICIDCGLSSTHDKVKGRVPERCVSCRAARKRTTDSIKSKRWREANSEYQAAYMRQYHQKHKDDPEYRRMRREAFLVYKYGITQAELDARLVAQNQRCAICQGLRNHCHDTGRVRGALSWWQRTYDRRSDMATSPSQRWEDGVLVERAIETNRWKVNPDGTPVEGEEAEAKAVAPAQAENKSVKAAAKK